jgi:uncharacterized protein
MKRLIRIALGSVLLLVGLAGLILPFLQGWLFLVMGGIVLSQDIAVFARMERWIMEQFPNAGRGIDRVRRRFPILAR